MNPVREPFTLYALNRRSTPLFSSFFIVKAIVAVALVLSSNGCSSTKQTWKDWASAGQAATVPVESSTEISAPLNDAVPAPATEGPVAEPTTETTASALLATDVPLTGRAVHTNPLVLAPGYRRGDGAHVSPGFDLKMRNPDFPRTYIEAIYIDLSAPTNGVHLKWTGPNASQGPIGPWQLTPGRGSEGVDCDDPEESNRFGSLCTPKGIFPVAGFADHLEQTPICRYATWVLYAPRYVAIHSHVELPTTPASAGCVRVPYEAAKLIHNNSLVGITMIHIGGTWQGVAKKN